MAFACVFYHILPTPAERRTSEKQVRTFCRGLFPEKAAHRIRKKKPYKNRERSMIRQTSILSAFQDLQELAGPGAPVCVCVTDEHGFILGYTQMDGSSSRSFTMARAKAYTAARMGQSTAAFHERLVREHLSLADFGDTLMTSVQGGVPVRGKGGELLGGVAVSGRRPAEDEALALRIAERLIP